MNKEIIGISGSPIPNSNTDRFIKHILKSSGLSYEFVKLSDITVRPCLACKACVKDNVCKVNDDFPELAKKLLASKAVVIGGYAPYRMIDGYTKAFIERLWSMRHLHRFKSRQNCCNSRIKHRVLNCPESAFELGNCYAYGEVQSCGAVSH